MFDQVYGVTYTIYSMKNRVLLTMLIIFIVLSGVWIACGTIFVVREIEIVDTRIDTADALTDVEKNDIITKSGLCGKNILFNVNETKVAQSIKSVNSMIKLQSITAQFPNRVILVLSRRVPIFYDGSNYYDAEMCKVEGTSAGCVNISNAYLNLVDDLKYGDMAVGIDEATNCKLNQLKTIAAYYDSIKNFEISYDSYTLSNTTCLVLKINAQVTFQLTVGFHADFLHALEYTQQIYQQEQYDGVYETYFGFDQYANKVVTRLGGNEYDEK